MPNGAIWVHTGLLQALDSDDELAAVLGHELAHYTHEHTRRLYKKSLWIGLAAAASGQILADATHGNEPSLIAHQLAFSAWQHHYSRQHEDQADRVGLRYAAEAGYDVTASVRVWQRVLRTEGDSNRVENFFTGSHSLITTRIAHLQEEIRNNYSASSAVVTR